MIKNIKQISFLLLALVVLNMAQGQNLSATIKVQAMDMADALMKNDFDRFVKYMHPGILAFAGGKDTMKLKMDSAYHKMKRMNVRFKRYWIGSPGEIVSYNNQLQAVLPQSTVIVTPLGDLQAESNMLVISTDKGKSWWFIDTNVYKADKLKQILPGISPNLVIPPSQKPKLLPRSQQ